MAKTLKQSLDSNSSEISIKHPYKRKHKVSLKTGASYVYPVSIQVNIQDNQELKMNNWNPSLSSNSSN